MKNTWIAFLGGIIVIAVASYALNIDIFKHPISKTQTTRKLQVITSFYPMYFFASQIAGDKTNITNITPSGAEPHDYEPTAQDIARIEKSDLLILNGGKLEVWEDNIKNNLKGTNVNIIVAGDKLASQQIEEKGKIIQDPHVWLSPPLAKLEIQAILNGFVQVDPINEEYYQSNAKRLNLKLDELDKEYKQGLSTCKQTDIITSHAAFGYLTTAYKLHQTPISGLSPDEEPSLQQLAEVVKFAKEHNVKYIFFESIVSPKLSETIANEIGAKTLVLDPIEGISEKNIRTGKNYLTIMKDNLTNLRIALECQ